MARLLEKSKMDLDARTTVNQQKNKKQELMVCWFPHGRLWAVYLVLYNIIQFIDLDGNIFMFTVKARNTTPHL